ncbi:MAG: SPOR domain-containing protein [Bacteroidia bacterium]|nr:SPOR domain-containing protein [Bacteroidia bacterium]
MNVQQTILSGIKEQLFFNDYLVLPNFGGFVLKSKPAHFSASGGMLVPAAKTVGFNAQLKQNDGVMAIWLQTKLNCSAAEALTHLTEFAGFCSGLLNTKRRLTLDGIGFFYLDFENNVCFEPQADVNFMTSSFGLSAISLNELEPLTERKKEREPVFVDRILVNETPVIVEKNTAPKKRNYRRVIMPVAILFLFLSLMGLLVSNSKITGNLKSSLWHNGAVAAFNPIDYPELKLVENKEKSSAYVADANGIAGIELDDTKTLAVRVIESTPSNFAAPKKSQTLLRSSLKTTGNFQIVLGCFSVKNNANRMVSKLAGKNVEAYISDQTHKGMHVVSLGSFETKMEASQKLESIQNEFPHAWIKQMP